MAPLFKYGLFGEGVSLALAILIGFGFGFALERAGFGSAKKLVAPQFYLTNLAVFKVMFTPSSRRCSASLLLAALGVLNLGMVYVEPTHLLPQTVGGFVLGAGFIIGGYCPGTSIVGIASGRRDALFSSAAWPSASSPSARGARSSTRSTRARRKACSRSRRRLRLALWCGRRGGRGDGARVLPAR